MKKTLVSLAAVAAITSGAMAADKGVDLTTSGQAVIYYQTYQTDATGDKGIFDADQANANVGLQLNVGGDIGNGFVMGSQLSFIDAFGLNNNLVGDANVMQVGGSVPNTKLLGATDTTNDLALTKIFVAKHIGNTTLKIGRQELPKSLSPLAFSQDDMVFKNTFDAVVAINSDIPDTTLVGAYVGAANENAGLAGLSTMTDLQAGTHAVTDGAYMLTVANKSIPMTALTASYYTLHGVDLSDVLVGTDPSGNSASAYWVDAKVAGKDMPLGLNIGLQYGSIMLDLQDLPTAKDTTAMGIDVGLKPTDALSVNLIYTTVDDGSLGVRNTGTWDFTPLYSQLLTNQDYINSDNDTIAVKGGYSMGDMGAVSLAVAMTTDNAPAASAPQDFMDIELAYTLKAGGVDYLAGYIRHDLDDAANTTNTGVVTDVVRVWARYNF